MASMEAAGASASSALPQGPVRFMNRGPARRSKTRSPHQQEQGLCRLGPALAPNPEPQGPALPPLPRLWGVNMNRCTQSAPAPGPTRPGFRFHLPPSGQASPQPEAVSRPVRHADNDPRQAHRRAARPVRTRGVTSPDLSTLEQAQHNAQALLATPASSIVYTTGTDQVLLPPDDNSLTSFWVCIHQEGGDHPGHVYFHHQPLSLDVWDSLPAAQRPEKLMSIHGCRFARCWDIRGHWHNFHLQSEGGLPLYKEAIVWPNKMQLLGPHLSPHVNRQPAHTNQQQQDVASLSLTPPAGPHEPGSTVGLAGSWAVSRCKHNWGSLEDVVMWLADPSPDHVRQHLANILKKARAEPGPQQPTPEVIYSWLSQHWGVECLLDLGFTRAAVISLIADPSFADRRFAVSQPVMQLHYRAHLDSDLDLHASLQSMTDPDWDQIDTYYLVKGRSDEGVDAAEQQQPLTVQSSRQQGRPGKGSSPSDARHRTRQPRQRLKARSNSAGTAPVVPVPVLTTQALQQQQEQQEPVLSQLIQEPSAHEAEQVEPSASEAAVAAVDAPAQEEHQVQREEGLQDTLTALQHDIAMMVASLAATARPVGTEQDIADVGVEGVVIAPQHPAVSQVQAEASCTGPAGSSASVQDEQEQGRSVAAEVLVEGGQQPKRGRGRPKKQRQPSVPTPHTPTPSPAPDLSVLDTLPQLLVAPAASGRVTRKSKSVKLRAASADVPSTAHVQVTAADAGAQVASQAQQEQQSTVNASVHENDSLDGVQAVEVVVSVGVEPSKQTGKRGRKGSRAKSEARSGGRKGSGSSSGKAGVMSQVQDKESLVVPV